ncbi:MAG TPA: peptidoglycan-binding protein [Thermoanaerobaculia bacterium]|nr:peptidoglycan-binding protein [Thermoanaerobaculia bacterium]
MTLRERREALFVGVAAAALGAWWLSRARSSPGGHKVGQDLASFFRGLGAPPLHFEVRPPRRRYFPARRSLERGAWPSRRERRYAPAQDLGDYGPAPSYPVPAQPSHYAPEQDYYIPTYPPSYIPTQPLEPFQPPAAPVQQPQRQMRRTLPLAPARPNFVERWRVEQAQGALNALYGNLLEEDGVMGPKTSAVLRMFQKQHGLPETGAVDDPTRAALEAARQPHEIEHDDEIGWWASSHPSDA